MMRYGLRYAVLGAALLTVAGGLAARAAQLQWLEHDFLNRQAEARQVRELALHAHRGAIMDRNGELLAVSVPVEAVWADPPVLLADRAAHAPLAAALGLPVTQLVQDLAARAGREFMYLARHLDPAAAAKVAAVDADGVYRQTEYRRYYPAGEAAAHVLGFTDRDQHGIEGAELAFEDWLRGQPGAKRVRLDGSRQIVADLALVRAARTGQNLRLALDARLQYLVHRELKAAVTHHQAQAGSAVLLDPWTGEILALANLPSFNPNQHTLPDAAQRRNRALTDPFEPGSTLKPFTVGVALESGRYQPGTPIDTAPGTWRVGRKLVRDIHDYGLLDVAGVIRKSSNVGMAKIALDLAPAALWGVFDRLGLGQSTGCALPGESGGVYNDARRDGLIQRATLSYGYGVSVTALKLAQMYGALASNGRLRPVSLRPVSQAPRGERVLDAATVAELRGMMEGVVSADGTASSAQVPHYRVAGKTGTVVLADGGRYDHSRYVGVFAGMAPASRPRVVMVVVIREPQGSVYYGGQVAAPVFAAVIPAALRWLNVPPDAELPTTLLAQSAAQ